MRKKTVFFIVVSFTAVSMAGYFGGRWLAARHASLDASKLNIATVPLHPGKDNLRKVWCNYLGDKGTVTHSKYLGVMDMTDSQVGENWKNLIKQC